MADHLFDKVQFQFQKREKGILLSDEDTATWNADRERSEKPESIAPQFFRNPYVRSLRHCINMEI